MQKILFITSLLMASSTFGAGQTFEGDTSKVRTPDGKEHYNVTPKYPGGKSAFIDELATNMRYNQNRVKDTLSVTISFQIGIDGRIRNVSIVKSGGNTVDKATIKALKKMK